MATWSFIGDPSKIVEYALDKAAKEIEERYKEIEEYVMKTYTEKVKRLLNEMKREFDEKIRSIEYLIESNRSRLEIEYKNKINELRNSIIEELFERAREEILNKFSQDERLYERFLREYVKQIIREFREGESIIIETDSVGALVLERFLREENSYSRYRVSVRVSNRVRKGFEIYSESRDIIYRYDIDTLIESVREELKISINKALVGVD
ncbi:MAG: hypothetical protein ABWJ42_04805 [Sulfolobales archaeon]